VVIQFFTKLDAQLAKLKEIREKDVPAFNQLVREQAVPAIMVSKKGMGTGK